MASSPLSKAYPAFYASSSNISTITKEELYSFHSIDRALFTRLVLGLDCSKDQSLRAMALWIWLERASSAHVVYTISKFPDPKLLCAFDEAMLCLKLVEDELGMVDVKEIKLPLTQGIATKMDVCAKFFIDNRVSILAGLKKAFQDVCAKAFDDIIEKVSKKKIQKPSGVGKTPNLIFGNGPNLSTTVFDVLKVDKVNMPMPTGTIYTDSTIVHSTLHRGSTDLMRTPLQDEISNKLKVMHLSNKNEQEGISSDERTIFLTFSKGYPIPRDEVRDFFTRLVGDLVENVHMQDVTKEDQPLYARLVLREPGAIYKVLGGQSKAKFSINGKHVWARKYVHKAK